MIEDELRAAFARHEPLAPDVAPVRVAIDRTVVRRRRRRFRLRLGGTALALVVAALVGVPAFTPDRPPTVSLLPGLPMRAGALNVLLLGVDGDQGRPYRVADSAMLVHVPADRSRLYLVSLPRYLEVPVPGRTPDRLSSVFQRGAGEPRPDLGRGYRATRDAVAKALGVPVDAGAVLTYPMVRAVTDAVGGVEVCLPQRIHSTHSDRVFPAGCQRLDGTASMDLLRQRRELPDGSLDRDRNAERYAAALLRRVGERGALTDPVVVNTLLQQVGAGLVADTGDSALPTLVSVATQAADAEPVAVVLPGRHVANHDLRYRVDPTLGRGFLDALRADRLAEWTAAHPEQVTSLR